MLKKIFTLLCLAAFVGSITACGGGSGPAFQADDKAKESTPLSSDTAEEAANAEVF